ncbi:MAG: hypothetical protein A3G80_07640 [Betaproteobacteria bacterium RIFCSPLOWO2_12_FULL_62_13b]|nr:MAG: hypothetical protein A3G80_07640 [Betaproteobacteria bacterium RIFCSPLOWO2_12_FULL_62_13b]
MDTDSWLLLAVFVIGLVALLGFFITKTKGFGRYATSTFLLLLVLIIAGLLFTHDKLDGHVLANLLFAVIGFAGGLFTGKDSACSKPKAELAVPNGTVSDALQAKRPSP